ncbi:hypothetical protein ACFIOY_16680 [Bradyrhizobium sp. TZ2]
MSGNMKILYAIAILALVSTSAQAWQMVERCTFSRFYGRVCTTTYLESQPRNLAQEQEDEKGAARQHRKMGSVLQADAHL